MRVYSSLMTQAKSFFFSFNKIILFYFESSNVTHDDWHIFFDHIFQTGIKFSFSFINLQTKFWSTFNIIILVKMYVALKNACETLNFKVWSFHLYTSIYIVCYWLFFSYSFSFLLWIPTHAFESECIKIFNPFFSIFHIDIHILFVWRTHAAYNI